MYDMIKYRFRLTLIDRQYQSKLRNIDLIVEFKRFSSEDYFPIWIDEKHF